jgi:hypothetical protein
MFVFEEVPAAKAYMESNTHRGEDHDANVRLLIRLATL